VFRNNRNKQKTNRNSSKFVKISTFLIHPTIISVFRLFRYWSETSKQTKTNRKFFFLVSWKTKPNNNRNRLSFGLFRFFKPRNKINGFEDPLIENIFWRFFWFVSVCFEKILFVSVVSIPVRNTETNRKKMFFGFAKQTEKKPKQIEFRFVSVRTEKKI
jgi:hypothetical protein